MDVTFPCVIGIDLGGTKLLLSVIDAEGHILAREKMPSSTKNADDIVTQIITGVESLRSSQVDSGIEISGIGIGVPGTVDTDTGHVVETANLPLDDVPLGRKVSDACGLSTVVGNDVTLATMGEAWYGAGRGVKNLFGIFVGTGIGGGLVIDGSIHTGAHGGAGEVGHMLMDPDGPKCGCGRNGCFEALASRTAIERDISALVKSGRDSTLTKRVKSSKRMKSNKLRKALEEKDEVATEVLDRAARYIGYGIGSVVNLLDPDVVVVGGGLIESTGFYMMPRIINAASERMMSVPGGPIPIVESALGDDAGILGAAALALNEISAVRPTGLGENMPAIEWIGPGEVKVNGQRRTDDLFVRGDGSIHKRRRRLSRREFGTDLKLSRAEIEYVCRDRSHTLIVGAGGDGNMLVSDEAKAWLDNRGIRLRVLPSAEAITEYRSMYGPRTLLLHVRS